MTETHWYSCALYVQGLTGEDVCMDIYMMFYILHCTETTFVYLKGDVM